MSRYFEQPIILWLSPVLAIAVALLLIATFRRRRARLSRLGSPAIIARLVPPASAHTPRWRALVLGLAAACAGVAFAGPRWGMETTLVAGGGADVVLALDASLSMLATDERPDRLERMKQEARRILAASGGDRFGLIAFAGRSYILTPLTVDRGALELFLDNLDPSVVGQAGSSLARAIRQGTDLLSTTRGGSDRALIVMSDGEAFEPEEEVIAAARQAAEAGITIVTVGFGTPGGATIPVRTTAGTSPKRDETGEVIVTRYSPQLLRAAAEAANGAFVDAGATDKASRVRSALASLRRDQRRSEAGRDRRARFQLFLIPAVLLALLDTTLAERRGRRRRATPAAATAAAGLVLALILPGSALAAPVDDGETFFRAGRYADAAAAYQRAVAEGDRSPRTLYNLGTALLAAGRGDEAVDPLERAAASRDLELRYRALFNLGLLYLRRGRGAEGEAALQAFSASVDAYKRALRLRPNEHDAKWNYELANKARKQTSAGGGGGGGEQPQQPDPSRPPQAQAERPSGSLDPGQAAQLLNSAAREEREVQGKKQRQSQPERPPGGKDW